MSPLDVLRGLGNVARKELLETLRDRRMVFTLVLAPLVQLVLLGYAVNLDVDRIPTVVCDQDRTATSRAVVGAFFAGATFRQVDAVSDPERAEDDLESGKASAAIVIPEGYARRRARGENADVQVLVDATDAARSQVAAEDATQILSLLHGGRASAPPIDVARAHVGAQAIAIVASAGGGLEAAAREAGAPFLREAFADRGVRPDGSLVPRGEPGAMIADPARAAERARALAAQGDVDAICIHGDTEGAIAIARAVRAALGPKR